MAQDARIVLQQRLSQQLVMTPQLRQAIKILQVSRAELETLIDQELTENPVLEENADEKLEGPAEVPTVQLRPGAGSAYMSHWLNEAAKVLRIKLSAPFDQFPKKTQKMLLEGANGFPGILKILDQTFQESSEGYREWLTEYMSPIECEACHGKRLRPDEYVISVHVVLLLI